MAAEGALKERTEIVTKYLASLRDWLFDSKSVAVPERVNMTIRAQQERSEILVSLVQLLVVLSFATLYATTPMAEGQVQAFHFIYVVLLIYLAATMLRLVLALRHLLRDWMLYLSVVLDMALLVVAIWSFHLQYAQTAAFYLKAPTQVYFYIFIALRALRFEARFVIFAGLTAACSWAALTFYVLSERGGPANRTHDYVEYITSNSTLIGAEVDKIIVMLAVTLVLALAITRARRLLVRAIAEGSAARELSRFFAPEIAKRIAGSERLIAAGEGELRQAAILTTDLRGFTKLSASLSPGGTMKLLQDYQSRIVPIIQAHGGAIDKFLGDGILASFGAATPSPSYAADALRAGEAILAAADAWAAERQQAGLAPARIGLAIAHGQILFGAVGDADRLEYTVIGDAVNLAAKLEKHTKEERVAGLTTADTVALARQQGFTGRIPKPLPGRRVGGVAEPVDLAVLDR